MRRNQIPFLKAQIKVTEPKESAEVQASINPEASALQNEQTKMTLYQLLAQAQKRSEIEQGKVKGHCNVQNAKAITLTLVEKGS